MTNRISVIVAAMVVLFTAIVVASTTSTIPVLACIVAVIAAFANVAYRLHIHYNTNGM